MNEKRIQEVMDVEKRAQEMLVRATQEAEQLPVEAEREANGILESARASAQEEARRIVENAASEGEASKILGAAQERMAILEKLAAENLDKAVELVLDRVLGGA